MGLDMYLKANRYVSGWDHQTDEEKDRFKAIVSALGATDWVENNSPSVDLSLTVGYWRKANAIHAWFVTNCQNGVDECQETSVSREELQELKKRCLRVIALSISQASLVDKVTNILPPQTGFFFGSTDLDEWYFESLGRTVQIIDRALSMPTKFNFSYQSSW